MNGMVRGDSLTLVREWKGSWRKNKNTTNNDRIYDLQSRHSVIFDDRIGVGFG